MKHTPSPWEVKRFSNAAPVIVGEGWMGARRIAKVLYEGGSEDPEVHANAALIAAAPDMLEALEQVVWNWEYQKRTGGLHFTSAPTEIESKRVEARVTREIVEKAIAKAKGA